MRASKPMWRGLVDVAVDPVPMPMENDPPPQRSIASYRDDELILTEHMVVYQGKAHAGHEVRLVDVTHADLKQKVGLRPYRLVFVVLLLLSTFLAFQDHWILFLVLFALPLAWTRQAHICFTTRTGVLRIPVARRHTAEATSFLAAVEEARRPHNGGASEPVRGPTTAPFL